MKEQHGVRMSIPYQKIIILAECKVSVQQNQAQLGYLRIGAACKRSELQEIGLIVANGLSGRAMHSIAINELEMMKIYDIMKILPFVRLFPIYNEKVFEKPKGDVFLLLNNIFSRF